MQKKQVSYDADLLFCAWEILGTYDYCLGARSWHLRIYTRVHAQVILMTQKSRVIIWHSRVRAGIYQPVRLHSSSCRCIFRSLGQWRPRTGSDFDA